jgi:diacylglycerol kinase family enzyme
MIDVGQLEYHKKIAIVYNPNSGRKMDQRTKISAKLDEYNIKYEFMETKGF